jgi:GntR family transcriptional regulator
MYQVIYDDLASRISAGDLGPQEKLPSEWELAEQFGVSRMTVRQALDRLADEHMLVRRRGAGTFVAPQGKSYRRLNRLSPFRHEVGVGNAKVETVVHERESAPPPEEVRQRLGLKPRAAAVRLLRVRIVDGVPAAIQESWVPYAVAPMLARVDLVDGSLYQTLRDLHGVEVRWADQEISAAAADPQQAAWLDVPVGSPLMKITRTTHGPSSRPVEFAHSWTLPRFPLFIRLEA